MQDQVFYSDLYCISDLLNKYSTSFAVFLIAHNIHCGFINRPPNTGIQSDRLNQILHILKSIGIRLDIVEGLKL
jgi:hypothetical protein